ncbi:uncharacterized protein LOC136073141 [Hydra vulgaris]|uniref:uncharacterized protein LOC136073141 n=1 Tax=Hydra vulgaris TaxID=6087 RepID=UPI0032EA8263
MVIDIFSKYGWIIPLKSKTGIEVADAFNKIFKDRKCAKLWVDKGLEFYNKHVRALGVHLYSTENEEKSCHSSTKMTPVEASNKKNENKVWLNLNSKVRSEHNKLKFTIGDKVRIIKKKELFEKGYTPRWTEEVFTVSQIKYTDPPTYKITDYNNEEIQDRKIVSNNGNAKKTTVMYSFIPIIVSKNSVNNEQPISKKYFPLKTKSISEMKIDIIDNFNKPIDFNNESYTIEFHIRERKK